MVNSPIALGGIVGVVLSGVVVYWQVGRYAAPQVPESLFEERKVFVAYAAGLFVGVPLALAWIFYVNALGNGAVLSAGVDLALLLLAGELAQLVLRRSRYFGGDASPFYAVSMRAGAGGLLAIAVVAGYLSGPFLGAVGALLAGSQAVAVVAVESSLSLVASPRKDAPPSWTGGSPVAGALFGALGFVLAGAGALVDPWTGTVSAVLAVAGATWLFVRRRDAILGAVAPPSQLEARRQTAFGRTSVVGSRPRGPSAKD